jgi:hypothetical protein
LPGIFISYRRGETSAYAGRLYDRLAAEFGEANVFIDLNAIDPGADFVARIEEAVGSADALIVVIGPDWADAADDEGRRRLDDPQDFVRREVLGAIDRDVLVVPVLVRGAAMPVGERLPDPLRALGRRNALALTDAGWQRDVERLVATLRARLPEAARHRARGTTRRRRFAALAAGAALLCGALVAVVVATRGEDPRPSAPKTSLKLAAEASVGGYPLYAAIAGGKVWVAQDGSNRLKTVDAKSRSVGDTSALGRDLRGLAASSGRLWVGDYGKGPSDPGSVVALDPATGRRLGRPIETADPAAIAADGESVWVAGERGVLDRVDIRQRRVVDRVRVKGLWDVAVYGGTVWVTSPDENEVRSFDARTGEPAGRPIDIARPVGVAPVKGAVWVTNEQGQLFQIRPGRPLRSLAVGGEGRLLVKADAEHVWVADSQGHVVLVDPRRFVIEARLSFGGGVPQDLALDDGGAWVLRARSGAASTVARVELTEPQPQD